MRRLRDPAGRSIEMCSRPVEPSGKAKVRSFVAMVGADILEPLRAYVGIEMMFVLLILRLTRGLYIVVLTMQSGSIRPKFAMMTLRNDEIDIA